METLAPCPRDTNYPWAITEMAVRNMKYSIRAGADHWPKETLEDFTTGGEPQRHTIIWRAVRSKRRATKVGDWIETAETPAASGKQVVLATSRWCRPLLNWRARRYVDNGEFPIQASDSGVVISAPNASYRSSPGMR